MNETLHSPHDSTIASVQTPNKRERDRFLFFLLLLLSPRQEESVHGSALSFPFYVLGVGSSRG